MRQLADDEVMLKYQEGDALAMDELLRRYKNPVYHFAYRMCFNAHEAQDVTQEVFLRVHQYKDTYKPQGKFSTWLFSIAHNLCVSRLRRKKWWGLWPRMQDDPDELVEVESPDPSPSDIAEENDQAKQIKQCIQELPFLQREALLLREYQDLEYHEIAKILKKPLNTVRTLLYRARQTLQAKLLMYVREFGEV